MNRTLRITLWAGAALTLLAAAAALLMLWWLFGAGHGAVDVRINGQPLALPEWPFWRDGHGTPDWPGALGVGGALLGALALGVAVPLLLLLMLLLGTLGGAVGIAAVVLVLAVVVLMVLSPLWLALLLVWLLLRRDRLSAPRPQP